MTTTEESPTTQSTTQVEDYPEDYPTGMLASPSRTQI